MAERLEYWTCNRVDPSSSPTLTASWICFTENPSFKFGVWIALGAIRDIFGYYEQCSSDNNTSTKSAGLECPSWSA